MSEEIKRIKLLFCILSYLLYTTKFFLSDGECFRNSFVSNNIEVVYHTGGLDFDSCVLQMTADRSNSPSIDLYQRSRAGRILSSEMQQWHFAMSGLETDCIVTLRYVGLEGEERRWVGGPRSQTMSLCMRYFISARDTVTAAARHTQRPEAS